MEKARLYSGINEPQTQTSERTGGGPEGEKGAKKRGPHSALRASNSAAGHSRRPRAAAVEGPRACSRRVVTPHSSFIRAVRNHETGGNSATSGCSDRKKRFAGSRMTFRWPENNLEAAGRQSGPQIGNLLRETNWTRGEAAVRNPREQTRRRGRMGANGIKRADGKQPRFLTQHLPSRPNKEARRRNADGGNRRSKSRIFEFFTPRSRRSSLRSVRPWASASSGSKRSSISVAFLRPPLRPSLVGGRSAGSRPDRPARNRPPTDRPSPDETRDRRPLRAVRGASGRAGKKEGRRKRGGGG